MCFSARVCTSTLHTRSPHRRLTPLRGACCEKRTRLLRRLCWPAADRPVGVASRLSHSCMRAIRACYTADVRYLVRESREGLRPRLNECSQDFKIAHAHFPPFFSRFANLFSASRNLGLRGCLPACVRTLVRGRAKLSTWWRTGRYFDGLQGHQNSYF